jgi:error-prone DNA polymerase
MYAELHCHTNYSFQDGASWAQELAQRAVELGYTALAVTDHDGLRGAVRFHQAATASGIPAVYGTEIGMPKLADDRSSSSVIRASNNEPIPGPHPVDQPPPLGATDLESPKPDEGAASREQRTAKKRGRTHPMHGSKPLATPDTDHLVLLASSPQGYSALSHLVSKAQFRGRKDRPVYDWGDLAEAAARGELVGLSGCHRGAMTAAASRGDLEGAVAAGARLKEVFDGRFYAELWHHGMPEDDPRNDLMAEAARRLRVPTIATNNVHYHDRSQADLSEVLAAIGGRRDLDAHDGFRPATDERYLKSPLEMERRLARYPGAVRRAANLGADLAFDLALVAPRLPDYGLPGSFTSEAEYLRHLVHEGARQVYPDGAGGVEWRAEGRLNHELEVIEELEFAGYFLVVWDIVQYARSRDIYCQIRGSGADSAVCRCLGLTRVDPIRLNLPFERFLSEERGRPPDIDVDFEAERREEVIQYCYQRYGRERAAMVANVITYRARSVLQDVGKAFGLTQAQVSGLTRYVDSRKPQHLASELELPEGLTTDLIYDMCTRLDGFPRHLGIHSGGMVMADRPLWEVVPLEWGRMEDRSVLQWDKDDCAAMGVVKFDLLALGMLNALHLAVDMIGDAHGVAVDLATIDQEPIIYDMLTKADTVGLFQVESRAQMATLPKMKPKDFYDLAIEVALIRPGPIQGHSVHPFLRRRNGEEKVSYPHPLAEPILRKTLGVPVFQEQLMELARVCAGFSPGQSDRLRSAMTHKRSDEEMAKLAGEVYDGMARNGITGAAADEIWEKLQGFASFGFPESHSVSFAYIVYASAWLKYHWPAEFLAGLLNAQPMGFYSPNTLVQDAIRHGVMVLAPDINVSEFDCTIEPVAADPNDIATYYGLSWRRGRGPTDDPVRPATAVRMGLRYVRDLGEAEIARIEAARQVEGPFSSAEDLAQRTGIAGGGLEGLAAAGALGSVGMGRRDGLWAAGALADLGPGRLAISEGAAAPSLQEMDPFQAHQADLWSTGVSATHPVHFARPLLADRGCMTVSAALSQQRHGIRARVGGIITHRQRPGTAKGIRFLNLEDESGLLNVVVMPQVWEQHYEVARKAVGVIIEGRLEFVDGVTNLVAHRFWEWPVEGVKSRDFR